MTVDGRFNDYLSRHIMPNQTTIESEATLNVRCVKITTVSRVTSLLLVLNRAVQLGGNFRHHGKLQAEFSAVLKKS